MSNSGLINYSKLSPNKNSPRNHNIDTITIHCYVGQASVEDMGAWFAQSSAQASANYGIGSDGRIALFVPENDRSWCSSSRENDHRAVTIECASDKTEPYAVNDKVYASLINLCADICQRNGIKALKWSTDKAERVNHRNGCNMTVHRDYAAKACPGDYIYSRLGQIADEVNALLSPAPSGIPTSKADFIQKVSKICVKLWNENKILPSVVIGQACLESGFGLGADAAELTKRNNLLGMKSDLINNTWKQYTVWDGKSFNKVTPEYRDGKLVYITDSFRIYKNYENCIRDYEQFLLHVRNDLGYKYRSVQGLTDPRSVITIISKGGYATDPAYIDKVMKVISENNLTKYDEEAGAVDKDRYVVRRRWSESKYQIGAFHILDNAKKMADENWGFRVYDLENPNKAIYKPQLTRWQKLCAACVRINQWLVDDIKIKIPWRYYNTGHVSESTFWKTRKAKKYFTNCMGGVGFAMKESGLPISACSWYGQNGGTIRWLNDHAEKDLRKYADLIKVGNKTVRQAMNDGTICPGDILTLVEINHTFIYLGNGLFFDSGHAYCDKKSGEGVLYVKWIGGIYWSGYHLGWIIRLKG